MLQGRVVLLWLLRLQRVNRIDGGSASSRQIACQCCSNNQDNRDCDERYRIKRMDTEQQRSHELREYGRSREAYADTDTGEG